MNFKHYSRQCFTLLLLCSVLQPLPSEDLDLPVIVTFIDETVVEQRQTYTAEEIEKLHVESLPSLLNAAGIQILQYGAYGLQSSPSIRGFTDETVRVVINGICVNNAQYGTFDFTSININDIEKIEIVKGGFTEGTSDEGAVGGVIYITTKKQTLGHHFSAETSLKSYFNQELPLTLDTFNQKLGYSGQISQNSFLKTNLQATYANNQFTYAGFTKQQFNSQVKDMGGDGTYSLYFRDGSSFTATDLFYAGNKSVPGPEYSKNIGNQKDTNNKLVFNITNPAIAGILKMENNLAWLSDTRIYDSHSEHSKHYINTFKYAGNIDLYNFDRFQQLAGITLDYVHLDSTDDGVHNQISGAFKETSRFQFNKIFSASIPLAIKFSGQNFAFTPKAGIRADFPYISLMLDGYRMTQFPNMDDMYWKGDSFHGNPELKPENGWGADFTINAHDIILPFSLCVFTNYYENKIQWASKDGVWAPQNVASVFYLGADLNISKSFFNEMIIFRTNAEYLYTALLNKNSKYEYKKRIMWTPDFVASGSITLNLDFMSLTIDGNYVGKRYTSNMNISYLEPYFLLNAVCELKTFAHVKPFIRGENLLNCNYQSVENYPMPGISMTFGASASL